MLPCLQTLPITAVNGTSIASYQVSKSDDFLASEIIVIESLIRGDKWIEEESLDLIELLEFNNA